MQGASEQCMQATEMERSPGLPSLMVTTRRRFTPQGTSCSFLQAVTQALHSMQRSASQRNFIRAIFQLLPLRRLYAAKCGFAFLHAGHHVVDQEHTSELQSLMRISYAVFCLKQKTTNKKHIVHQLSTYETFNIHNKN